MRMRLMFVMSCALLALGGCNKAPAPAASSNTAPQATLTLKDGSTFAGSVTKSDTSAITVQTPGGESRTYPMTQVASIQYADQTQAPVQTTPAPAPGANTPPPPPQYTANPQPVPPSQPAAPPQPVEEFRTIPAGRTLEVRNNSTISSETAAPGQTWSAVVARDVTDTTGAVAIPHGAGATLVIREANGQGKVEGRSELVLDVGSVTIAGKTYRLETSDFVEKGKPGIGENARTGKFLGGGAALGGIIGAIAGGGKGAAIGVVSGAAAGGATQAATRGHAVRVPAETILTFRLEAPIRIREMR